MMGLRYTLPDLALWKFVGLFFLINGWAGQYPLLDATLRTWYVSAVPVLATLFVALALLSPSNPLVPRRRILACAVLAFALCALTKVFVDSFGASINAGLLSPRPYMTRYVNVLVMEPQDNSFPSPEVMLAATLAMLVWAINPRFGLLAVLAALSLAFTRMFCGTNYFADVLTGYFMGTGWALLALAAFRIQLATPWAEARWQFPLAPQAAAAGVTLFAVVSGTYVFALSQPRFENKLSLWAAPATAATGPKGSVQEAARGARDTLQEGEGVAAEGEPGEAEALSLAKRSNRFLPDVEKYLMGVLQPKTRPFHLLEVEVAPVKAGTTEYRCAALRLEVPLKTANARRWVFRVAADLVRTSFALDSQLENVDVTAVVRGDGKEIDGSSVVFVGGEIPVFTASIQRKNLITQPAWTNLPNVDPGLWLRARSRLFINEKVLPAESAATPAPLFPGLPAPAPAVTPNPAVTLAPIPSPIVAPSAVPTPQAKAIAPRPVARPKVEPHHKPVSPWRRPPVSPRPVKRQARTWKKPATAEPTNTVAPPAMSSPSKPGSVIHSGPSLPPPALSRPSAAPVQPQMPAAPAVPEAAQ